MNEATQCSGLEARIQSQQLDNKQIAEALSVALCWLEHAYCLSRYVASYTEDLEDDAFAIVVNELMDLTSEAIDKFDELSGGN